MKPTAHPFALTRTSPGLSPAHIQLIKLLAEKTVSDFLAETDSADTVDEPADEHEAAQ